MSTPTILRVSHADILEAENAAQLIAEYAAECSVPDANPQAEQYAALEQAGALQCFGAYVDGTLIGFASVLTAIMPHHGKRVATVESIFVQAQSRTTDAALFLLSALEQYAAERDCVAMLSTARAGSQYDKLLQRRYNQTPSHSLYTRWL